MDENKNICASTIENFYKIKYYEFNRGRCILTLLQKYIPICINGIILDLLIGHGSSCVCIIQPKLCLICTGHTIECYELYKNRKCCYCSIGVKRTILWCPACPLLSVKYWVETDMSAYEYITEEFFRKDCGTCITEKNRIESQKVIIYE